MLRRSVHRFAIGCGPTPILLRSSSSSSVTPPLASLRSGKVEKRPIPTKLSDSISTNANIPPLRRNAAPSRRFVGGGGTHHHHQQQQYSPMMVRGSSDDCSAHHHQQHHAVGSSDPSIIAASSAASSPSADVIQTQHRHTSTDAHYEEDFFTNKNGGGSTQQRSPRFVVVNPHSNNSTNNSNNTSDPSSTAASPTTHQRMQKQKQQHDIVDVSSPPTASLLRGGVFTFPEAYLRSAEENISGLKSSFRRYYEDFKIRRAAMNTATLLPPLSPSSTDAPGSGSGSGGRNPTSSSLPTKGGVGGATFSPPRGVTGSDSAAAAAGEEAAVLRYYNYDGEGGRDGALGDVAQKRAATTAGAANGTTTAVDGTESGFDAAAAVSYNSGGEGFAGPCPAAAVEEEPSMAATTSSSSSAPPLVGLGSTDVPLWSSLDADADKATSADAAADRGRAAKVTTTVMAASNKMKKRKATAVNKSAATAAGKRPSTGHEANVREKSLRTRAIAKETPRRFGDQKKGPLSGAVPSAASSVSPSSSQLSRRPLKKSRTAQMKKAASPMPPSPKNKGPNAKADRCGGAAAPTTLKKATENTASSSSKAKRR